MTELLKDTKAKKSEKKRREERFNNILFNEDTSHAIPKSDSNDDMVYPADCDTLKDRKMYRRVIMEFKNEEWHREQIQRFHRMDNIPTYKGNGSDSGNQSTHKDKSKGIVGMFRIYSQRYDNSDTAIVRKETSKQKTIKSIFGNG